MIVASQPKVTFFNQEVLTMDCASESSQKQHIVDTMISLGHNGKISAPIAIMYIAKNRNGIPNKKVPLFIKVGDRIKIDTNEIVDEFNSILF